MAASSTAAEWVLTAAMYLAVLLVVRCLCLRFPRLPAWGRRQASRITRRIGGRVEDWLGRTRVGRAVRRRLGRDLPQPTCRPLEEVARDLRRLGPRLHGELRGLSRAKIVAVQYAYDRALGEAADALEVEHLLGVLETGAELDLERARVERRLFLAGLRVDEAA